MAGLRALMDLLLLRFLPRRGGLRISAACILLSLLVSSSDAQQAPIPPELQSSGKVISIRADSQQKDQDTYHLRGHVEILYEGMQVSADEASFDEASGEVMARGHVVFNDPQSHLAAEEVHYNIRTKKGWFSNGTGFVHPKVRPRPRVLTTENPFYFWGATVDRVDEDTYIVNHGRMTSCECEKKGWSVSVREARITVDDKAVAHGALFRLLGIPFFYTPFLEDSIAREPRKTGFLLPNIGNSTQKGYIIGGGVFWAINPSADLMLGLADFSKRGVSQQGEFRARPSQDSDLVINYFGVNDKDIDVALRAPGESVRVKGYADNLGYGFRGVLNMDYINTLAFRLTWSPNFAEAVNSEAVQSGFLSKNFDAYSLNISAERYQDFLYALLASSSSTSSGASSAQVPEESVIIRRMPSVEFSGKDKQVGNLPVYFSFDAQADAVGRSEPGLTLPLLSDRLDVHPQILLRPKEFWHFRFTPTIGFRATHYGTSLEADQGSLNRLLVEFELDLRPPSLEKVLARTYAGHRLKHVIEPDIQYHLVRARDPENILEIIRFDAMDIFTETNEVEYSLTNTLLARKDMPDNSPDNPQARDIFSWRISQKYYLDPTFGGALVPGQNNVFASTIDLTGFAFEHRQRFSPIDSVFKFAPFSNYDTEIRTDMNPSGAGGVLDAGITSHVKRGLLGVAFTDFFINRTSYFSSLLGSTTSGSQSTTPVPLTAYHLLGTVVTYGDPNHKGLSSAFGLDYNFQQKIVQQVVGQVSYNFGCFAIDMEYRRFDLGPLRRENQYRVALSLANVGTFGNLKPRERLY
jgi:LPS-assembly protein